jgi:DNA helicase-2/ATP-dependent DNA helicase PcrA
VGITRAKEELYLCRSRLRDFRGSSLYAVPSMFLEELPPEAIECVDVGLGGAISAIEHWRNGGPAAEQGWTDAGVRPIPLPIPTRQNPADEGGLNVGTLVKHATYGVGRIIETSGLGAMRKIKIRFEKAGERSFVASKVTLEILPPQG